LPWNSKNCTYSLLGELYRQVKLNLYAKDAYLKAADLAQEEGDLEAQAEAQAALGDIYVVLKDRTAAVEAFSKAKIAYVALEGNEAAQVRKITEQIAKLNP
jgi:tetratricopeptide (TPR) repeat protein